MFNRKTTALIAAGLLIFAMLASGGCLGDSDSSSVSKKWSLIGSISDEDSATLKEEAIELIAHKSGQTETTRSVLITKLASLTDDQKAEIKEMIAESKVGNIAILDPETAESITAFKEEILGSENVNKAIVKEGSLLFDKDGKKLEHARIRLYGMMKDSAGNFHSYGSIIHDSKATFLSGVRDNNISTDWVESGTNPKKSLRYNSKSGCYELVTYKLVPAVTDASGKVIEKEYVAQDSVTKLTDAGTDVEVEASDSEITAKLGGKTYDCAGVETKDKAYQLLLQDDGTTKLYTCDLEEGEDTRGDAPTEEEKVAAAKRNTLKHFVEWIREKKLTTEEQLEQAGVIKPKTRFEKFMAWAKDLLASNGIAFAGSAKYDLLANAMSYTGTFSQVCQSLDSFYQSVNVYVVPVHVFKDTDNVDGGDDIFYVTEKYTFTNDLAVTYYKDHWTQGGSYESHIAAANNDHLKIQVNAAECDEGYCGWYYTYTTLDGNCDVVCEYSKPDTENTEYTESVSHSHSLDSTHKSGTSEGENGASKSRGKALTSGYSASDTETYNKKEIETTQINNSGKQPAQIEMRHHATVYPHKTTPSWKLTKATDITKATYSPIQKFAWRIATADRDKYSGINVRLQTLVYGCYSTYTGAGGEVWYHMDVDGNNTITLPMPPRFCLDKDTVNFDTNEAAHIVVYSQGEWRVKESTVPEWLDVIDAGTQQLTLQPKTKTDKLRSADITVYRYGGGEGFDTRTIHVTQAVY